LSDVGVSRLKDREADDKKEKRQPDQFFCKKPPRNLQERPTGLPLGLP